MIKGYIKKKLLTNDLTMLAGTIAILLLVNLISYRFFFRVDLTAEKRYTLAKETRHIIHNLDDAILITIYLEGELNIPFSKFQRNIRDLMEEFKIYGGYKFQYEIVNPFEDVDQEDQEKVISSLYEQGLRPTNIHQRDKEGGISEKIIFPSALVTYKNIDVPLNLLMNTKGLSAEQNLNNSIENLEYNFISTIKNITNKKIEKIAFIEGHRELNEIEVNDISRELSKSYQIDRGRINGQFGILDEYNAVIIAKPKLPFSEPDKFVIDQYIMKGGKVIWLIDAVEVSLDSLVSGTTMAFIAQLDIEDMLFRYGVRINPVLAQDIQCNVIPINIALAGNTPDFQPIPWLYNPLMNPNPKHPITTNINLVCGRFTNIIDTISARTGIRKTALLTTSELCRTRNVPALITLDEVIRETPKRNDFNLSNEVTGVLLEGEFQSAFINRGLEKYFDNLPEIIEKGNYTKMAVIADGDVIRNEVNYTSGGPEIQPLGYDRYTRQTFGNKEFLVNLVQYIADDNNLLVLRGREFKLRLLDKKKIAEARTSWILINMIIPSAFFIIIGITYYQIRRFRFARRKNPEKENSGVFI
ncbi:MAG: gliding motility-associated ABC transporter substrate-binding protein GldG [Bacteroidales bacterium]|nr:gliding motility-associated ABC transporter substrate-binding protein GldG [Bacteroidales bacterium]